MKVKKVNLKSCTFSADLISFNNQNPKYAGCWPSINTGALREIWRVPSLLCTASLPHARVNTCIINLRAIETPSLINKIIISSDLQVPEFAWTAQTILAGCKVNEVNKTNPVESHACFFRIPKPSVHPLISHICPTEHSQFWLRQWGTDGVYGGNNCNPKIIPIFCSYVLGNFAPDCSPILSGVHQWLHSPPPPISLPPPPPTGGTAFVIHILKGVMFYRRWHLQLAVLYYRCGHKLLVDVRSIPYLVSMEEQRTDITKY